MICFNRNNESKKEFSFENGCEIIRQKRFARKIGKGYWVLKLFNWPTVWKEISSLTNSFLSSSRGVSLGIPLELYVGVLI